GSDTDQLTPTPSDSPHSQLLPGSHYTKSCFPALTSDPGTADRTLTFTSLATANQSQEGSTTSGQRWFVSSTAAPSYETDINTAALLSYATSGVKGLPFTSGTSSSLDYYSSVAGWDSQGLLENSSKGISNLPGWILDATLERSTQLNYMHEEDRDMLEIDGSALGVSEELEGKDAMDSTWTKTQSSIKS
ncbi:hypothetical protein M9458_023898, partial [Cirrhinus mrigala]